VCVLGGRGVLSSLCFVRDLFVGVGDFGGVLRVRTRNTLHIVGARKSSICYNAVEGREKMKNKKKRK
jgi:hypothetical protein